MITKTINTGEIVAFHEVRDQEKLDRLVAGMEQNGWIGRPLVVLDIGEYQALTGSHRIEAARIAGIEEIPVVIVEHGTMFDEYDYEDLKDPDMIYHILGEYDEEAAELFYEDVD